MRCFLIILPLILCGCQQREVNENTVGVYNLGVRKMSAMQVGTWNTAMRTFKVIGGGAQDALNAILDDEQKSPDR